MITPGPLCYLPTRFSYVPKEGEMVLYPVIDFLQSHLLIFLAVDRKLDHGHVGIRWSFCQRALYCTHFFLSVLWLTEKTRKFRNLLQRTVTLLMRNEPSPTTIKCLLICLTRKRVRLQTYTGMIYIKIFKSLFVTSSSFVQVLRQWNKIQQPAKTVHSKNKKMIPPEIVHSHPHSLYWSLSLPGRQRRRVRSFSPTTGCSSDCHLTDCSLVRLLLTKTHKAKWTMEYRQSQTSYMIDKWTRTSVGQERFDISGCTRLRSELAFTLQRGMAEALDSILRSIVSTQQDELVWPLCAAFFSLSSQHIDDTLKIGGFWYDDHLRVRHCGMIHHANAIRTGRRSSRRSRFALWPVSFVSLKRQFPPLEDYRSPGTLLHPVL